MHLFKSDFLDSAAPPPHDGKADQDKPRPSLILASMADALLLVSRVATFGAHKYTPDGWREVPKAYRRYTDAQLRHMFAHFSGETYDPETNLPHLAHEAWNALARLQLFLEAPKPPKPPIVDDLAEGVS